jgi:drug/metabolite transporter (DMT)-like permease
LSIADLTRLFSLAAIWGASFMFYRVVAPVLGPIWTAETRVLIAGMVLLALALATRARLEMRQHWRWYALVGVLNSGLPFALIAFAQLKLAASLAAILNATTPLWGALISALFFGEAFSAGKGAGLILGVLGVIVLVGWSPLEPGLQTTLSILAMLGATASYGLAANLTRSHLRGAPTLGMAVGSQLASSLALLPLMPFDLPRSPPDALVIACVLALALVCSALAYVLYFRLITDLGATRALTVTFLIPIFGTLWGVVFLREHITPEKILACAIILCGAGLVTGVLGSRSARE